MANWQSSSIRNKKTKLGFHKLRSSDVSGLSARALYLEPLEERAMLAVGPQLVSVFPDASETAVLTAGQVLHTAPTQLIFRFDTNIDPASLVTATVPANIAVSSSCTGTTMTLM